MTQHFLNSFSLRASIKIGLVKWKSITATFCDLDMPENHFFKNNEARVYLSGQLYNRIIIIIKLVMCFSTLHSPAIF